MAIDLDPGQWVEVKVISEPKSAAKLKTMERIFERDRKVTAERKRLTRSRPVTTHIRGGRPWADRPARLPLVKTKPGAKYRLFASVDILRDLGSLQKHIEVRPAK